MINLTTANNALKSVYLDVLNNMLNVATNPLLAQINHSTNGVYGKEIKVLSKYGINGGISATSETGELPVTASDNYLTFTSELKNLYGQLEISDKAVRASQSSAGAFVNLLNDEMEGLIKASAFNLSRMLYGNGTGKLGEITAVGSDGKTLTLDSVNSFMVGMIVDIYDDATATYPAGGGKLVVTGVNRANKTITINKSVSGIPEISEGGFVLYNQGSKDNELTGVSTLFTGNITNIYGLAKSAYPFLSGTVNPSAGALTELKIIEAMDLAEEATGGKINFISCSSAVRRKVQGLMITANKNIDTMEIKGGYKALDFYGTPIISDRFVDNDEMYLLNTDDFTMHQMCDWEWLTDDCGNVLTQKTGYPVYNATLVKYANLICSRPSGQYKFAGITIS